MACVHPVIPVPQHPMIVPDSALTRLSNIAENYVAAGSKEVLVGDVMMHLPDIITELRMLRALLGTQPHVALPFPDPASHAEEIANARALADAEQRAANRLLAVADADGLF